MNSGQVYAGGWRGWAVGQFEIFEIAIVIESPIFLGPTYRLLLDCPYLRATRRQGRTAGRLRYADFS